MDVFAAARANRIAPATFAASTMPHRRSRLITVALECLDMTGSRAVIVFSVNKCCRARMMTMKPVAYPAVTMGYDQDSPGSSAARTPITTMEKPMDSPAAKPDHQRAKEARPSSSSPSSRIIS